MFESLFSSPFTIRRHRDGPMAAERAAYLSALVAKGMRRGTILRRAAYCLCVAEELQHWPPEQRFAEEDVSAMANAWAAPRPISGRASSPRWPAQFFRWAALDFLRYLGRIRPSPAPAPRRYDAVLSDFIAVQKEGRWQSEDTCRGGRWQLSRYLDYLQQRGDSLEDVTASEVDAYFMHAAQRWSRRSLRVTACALRSWFRYCESRGLVRPGLAEAILLPRVYRHESLPLGPTWDGVGQMLDESGGDDMASIRDHAIILLLSVYGWRSGEVRRLCLDDIDWASDRIRLVRSKSGRPEIAPIEPTVGNAIVRYLLEARPRSASRVVFLTLKAPHRPLSSGGLYGAVRRRVSTVGTPIAGLGPHGLRHACARHLMASGRSLKEVGDHLGHQSAEAPQIYAKVNLPALRKVAFDDLGGLA